MTHYNTIDQMIGTCDSMPDAAYIVYQILSWVIYKAIKVRSFGSETSFLPLPWLASGDSID